MKRDKKEENRLAVACEKVVNEIHSLAKDYDPYEYGLSESEGEMKKYVRAVKALVKKEVKLALKRVGGGWDKLEGE